MRRSLFTQGSLIVGAFALIVTAQNCSPANFSPVGPDANSSGNKTAGTEGGSVDTGIPTVDPSLPPETPNNPENPPTENPPTNNPPTSNPPTVNPPVTSIPLPKISFDYEYCSDFSDCPKAMILSHSDPRRIQFQWKTNDALAPLNSSVYCQPNSQYVPKNGVVTYQPGETQQIVIVRSLDCSTDKQIPITIYNCSADGAPFNCALLVP